MFSALFSHQTQHPVMDLRFGVEARNTARHEGEMHEKGDGINSEDNECQELGGIPSERHVLDTYAKVALVDYGVVI